MQNSILTLSDFFVIQLSPFTILRRTLQHKRSEGDKAQIARKRNMKKSGSESVFIVHAEFRRSELNRHCTECDEMK